MKVISFLTDFPKKSKHQNVYKISFACPQITFNPNSTLYIETIELPLFAHGVGEKTKHLKIWHGFVKFKHCFLHFFSFSVRSIKNSNA